MTTGHCGLYVTISHTSKKKHYTLHVLAGEPVSIFNVPVTRHVVKKRGYPV